MLRLLQASRPGTFSNLYKETKIEKSKNHKSEKAQVARNGRAAYGISYTEIDLEHTTLEIR